MCKQYRSIIKSFAAVVIICSLSNAAIINVSEDNITDHADPSITGSIAWFFDTFGGGHTYILTTPPQEGTYKINSRIDIPSNTILKSEVNAVVQAQEQMKVPEANTYMFVLGDNCEIAGITADANRKASIVVRAVNSKNIIIRDCHFKDTRNYYSNGFNGRSHIIHAWDVEGLTVDNCILENGGCNPKIEPTTWLGGASAIDATRGRDIVVTNNEIHHMLSHGVTFLGGINVEIHNNTIWYTGRNGFYDTPGDSRGTGDGIGAYHNGLGAKWLNWNINDNDIRHYGNHAIHVSGRGIRLERNYISEGNYNGISIQDWREPHDCTQDVWVIDNYIAGHGTGMDTSPPMRYPIYVNQDYKPGSIHISGTTGNTDVWWGNRTCEGVPSCIDLVADMTGDCTVSLKDFYLFALEWGGCTDPSNPDCW